MSEEQVTRMLGRERSRVFYKLSGEDVWDWSVARGDERLSAALQCALQGPRRGPHLAERGVSGSPILVGLI
ncbi:hypothetical protein Ddc_19856 [Ditylenchus destructor]|nr:hypothetical protein Ddc_19856 [Ditylenchus destructor]